MVEMATEAFRQYIDLINLRRSVLSHFAPDRALAIAMAPADFDKLPEGWRTQLPGNVTIFCNPGADSGAIEICDDKQMTVLKTTTWPTPPSPLDVILPPPKTNTPHYFPTA